MALTDANGTSAEIHKQICVLFGCLQRLLAVAEDTIQHAKKASAFDLNALSEFLLGCPLMYFVCTEKTYQLQYRTS